MSDHTGLAARLRELAKLCEAASLATTGVFQPANASWSIAEYCGEDEDLVANSMSYNAAKFFSEVANAAPGLFVKAAAALEARPAPATEGEVEAVAKALAREARVAEVESRGFTAQHAHLYAEAHWKDHESRARAAISASRPSGEAKLRDLEQFASFAMRWSNPERRAPHRNMTAEECLSVIWGHPARAALSEQPETKEA